MLEFHVADCLDWMRGQPADRFDLVFGSPPYCDSRQYLEDGQNLGISRNCLEWVEWMLEITTEAARICRGPVLWVANGVVRERAYQPACEGLLWEAYRRRMTLERPEIWHSNKAPSRNGEWFSNAWEFVLGFKRPGVVPFFDWQAIAHPTRYPSSGPFRQRDRNGKRPKRLKEYVAPKLAIPRDVLKVPVGGGHMGSKFAHLGEAPFPEKLAAIFVRSCCPEGGWILDPFAGSGTTLAVAQRWGRNCVGVDLRESQIELAKRRCAQKMLL